MARCSGRGDIAQDIDGISSRTGNEEEQEATHYADVLVEAIHAVHLSWTSHGPIVMPDERSCQRVQNQEQSRRSRERPNSDRECNRKLHKGRDGGSQCRQRQAKLRHLTHRAREVPELSPTENQEQCREHEPRREDELIVVYRSGTLAPIISGSVRS